MPLLVHVRNPIFRFIYLAPRPTMEHVLRRSFITGAVRAHRRFAPSSGFSRRSPSNPLRRERNKRSLVRLGPFFADIALSVYVRGPGNIFVVTARRHPTFEKADDRNSSLLAERLEDVKKSTKPACRTAKDPMTSQGLKPMSVDATNGLNLPPYPDNNDRQTVNHIMTTECRLSIFTTREKESTR